MADEFALYRMSQDQMERLTDAMSRVGVMEKSIVALDAKFDRHMTQLDAKIERLADAMALQNKNVNDELADLRAEIIALKSENRFWRWGVAFSLGLALFTFFFVVWKL